MALSADLQIAQAHESIQEALNHFEHGPINSRDLFIVQTNAKWDEDLTLQLLYALNNNTNLIRNRRYLLPLVEVVSRIGQDWEVPPSAEIQQEILKLARLFPVSKPVRFRLWEVLTKNKIWRLEDLDLLKTVRRGQGHTSLEWNLSLQAHADLIPQMDAQQKRELADFIRRYTYDLGGLEILFVLRRSEPKEYFMLFSQIAVYETDRALGLQPTLATPSIHLLVLDGLRRFSQQEELDYFRRSVRETSRQRLNNGILGRSIEQLEMEKDFLFRITRRRHSPREYGSAQYRFEYSVACPLLFAY